MSARDVERVGGARARDKAAIAAVIAEFDFSRLSAYMVNQVGRDAIALDLAEYKRYLDRLMSSVLPTYAAAPVIGLIHPVWDMFVCACALI
jgi:hypothetical protein